MPILENIGDLSLRVSHLAQIIWKECYADILSEGQIDYMLDHGQSKEAISKQIADNGYEYRIITDNERDIGYYAFFIDGDSLFLSKIYVLHEARGKGFGTLALKDACTYAENHGLKTVSLRVNKKNTNAIKTYKANHFTICCEDKSDIGRGFFMDDYLMKKDIGQTW
ncbi:MAG: GNAT family N-acetyltransferase [Candidatus Methanomethylophilaceae archaeon]